MTSWRPCHAGATTAIFFCVAALQAGCALDSRGVLRELRAIEQQRKSPDFLVSLTSFARESDLADRVNRTTEDVVVQAYFGAANDAERSAVLAIAVENEDGTGRYLPLLCYVMVCEREPERRVEAAKPFARLRKVSEAISRSAIVLILGQLVEDLEQEHRRQMVLFCMEEFLRNACGYEIPGGERRERELPLVASGRATTRLVCSDPRTVYDWWKAQGEAMAKKRAFDR